MYQFVFPFDPLMKSPVIMRKIHANPAASHSVNGDPSTRELISAAVTGSEKLNRLERSGPIYFTTVIYRLNARIFPTSTTTAMPANPAPFGVYGIDHGRNIIEKKTPPKRNAHPCISGVGKSF